MANQFIKIRDGINLGSLTVDPVSAKAGDFYYNINTNKFRGYNGTSWENIATENFVTSEIAAIDFPVDSVNGQTGTVVLGADDVSAANQSLSNLTAPTAINQNLISTKASTFRVQTDNDIGQSIIITTGNSTGALNTGGAVLSSGLASGISSSGNVNVGSGQSLNNTSGGVSINTGSAALGSGSLNILTGNTNAGSAGNINLTTGENSLGTKGNVTITANQINLNADTLISFNNKRATDILDPSLAQDAATKNYVDTNFVANTEKGAALGVATLDGAGKVPLTQLPAAIMTYEGVWNATTNTPTLADGTGDAGMVYRVGTAGTQNLGSGPITFDVGDYVIYNGTVWEKSDTTDAVASVNGLTGIVSLTTTNIPEGTNKYYSSTLFNSDFATKTTTDLTEGSNLYFTDTRAKTAAVVNSTAGNQTDQAPSVDAIKTYVAANAGANTTLSNLTSPTNINQDLLPNTDSTKSLGDASHRFKDVYGISGFFSDRVAMNTARLDNSKTFPDGINFGAALTSDGPNKLAVFTSNNTTSTPLLLGTGNGTSGASGDITIKSGTATTTRGKVILDGSSVDVSSKNIINVLDPVNAQDAATKAYVDTAAASGANRTLSNLTAPTSINQNLVPATDITQYLGSYQKSWAAVYSNTYVSYSDSGTYAIAHKADSNLTLGMQAAFSSPANMPAGLSSVGGLVYLGRLPNASGPALGVKTAVASGVYNTGAIRIGTGDIFTGSGTTGGTGNIELATGVVDSGTGNSGSVLLRTGMSAGGTRGKVILDGSSVDVSSKKIENLAAPTADTDASTKKYVDDSIAAIPFEIVSSGTAVNNDTLNISLTASRQTYVLQGATSSVTLATTPFGTNAPVDGAEICVIGSSNSNTITINTNDSAKGIIGYNVTLGRGQVATYKYILSLDRYVIKSVSN